MTPNPIRRSIRIASALLGAFIATVGIIEAGLRERHFGLAAFFAGWGALMVAPLFSSRPDHSDLSNISKNENRYRSAMIACFAIAAHCYSFVFTNESGLVRLTSDPNIVRQVGVVGVSFWLVAFVLVFVFAYHQSKRKSFDGND